MKRYIPIITLLLLLLGNIDPISAQVTITGTVLDNTNKAPIEQAGIRILNAKDSAYVNGVATNMQGKFRIQVKPGKYIVSVSFLGYSETFVNIDAKETINSIGDIYLKDDGILLKEAVVTAKAVEIAVKGDTVEYNADSYKVQPSAVVEDLLKKMPGAEIDSEGKITINGKEVKKILVDGKEFFSDDPKVASKNLPAAMVEKLQVLDRKSDMTRMTGFDDGQEETVINLTVKPGMKQGVFGNTYAGYGSDDRYETNAMINYMQNKNQFTVVGGANNTNNAGFSDFASSTFGGMRRPRGLNFGGANGITSSINGGGNFAIEVSEKLKYGGDIRYGQTDNDVESHTYTQYFATRSTPAQFKTENNYGNNKSDNFNTSLRFEWTPDSATQIIFRPEVRYSKNSNWQKSDLLTTWENPNDTLNWGNSKSFSNGDGWRTNGTLELSRQLNKTGRIVSASLSGGFDNSNNEGSNISNTYFKDTNRADQIIDQIFTQKNNNYNWKAFVSYVEPLSKNNFLQLTYSFRKSHTESDKRTYTQDGLGNYSIIDSLYTRNLVNKFTNQEIGLNFKAMRKNYNYTVGLGIQPSSMESRTYNVNVTPWIKKNVVNFAPNVQFNYIWDKRTNLRIDYSGVTNQPSANQLADVLDATDPLNLSIGNPNLKPTFENRLMIRYRKFNPERASVFMVFGRLTYTSNDIVSYSLTDTTVTIQDSTIILNNGKRLMKYTNTNGNINANARMVFNRPLKNKKFSVNSMTFLSYSRNNAFVNSLSNVQENYRLQESAGIEYRSELFDLGLRGNFAYLNIQNSLADVAGQSTFNYGGNINTSIYLPYNFTIESDLNYATNSGYTNGFELNEWLWNASLAKQIFKAKNGTIRFKIYDILNQRANISRTSTTDYIRDTNTNTINSYFMFHFVYKFQIFKNGAKASDMEGGQRGFGPGGHPRI